MHHAAWLGQLIADVDAHGLAGFHGFLGAVPARDVGRTLDHAEGEGAGLDAFRLHAGMDMDGKLGAWRNGVSDQLKAISRRFLGLSHRHHLPGDFLGIGVAGLLRLGVVVIARNRSFAEHGECEQRDKPGWLFHFVILNRVIGFLGCVCRRLCRHGNVTPQGTFGCCELFVFSISLSNKYSQSDIYEQ
ncbi:hypothetical protein SDC9_169630 [bioreactor metagenome]|uniref:Uncharacterized protein n=1 Tax=bioreactor metagenome TaxID=1076179 RepID=A0A645G5Q2_9ZZZZ